MARPSYESLRSEYAHLFDTLSIRPTMQASVDAMARKVLNGKTRYQSVERSSGVPWFVIGLIHALEGSLSFGTHLHNGDPLSARTRHAPKGRPLTGAPPYTWEQSAADALAYDGLDEVTDWTIERIAYELEGYNGWGYRLLHADVLSPYLWSFSCHYSAGKYEADGKWSPGLVSAQVGAMVLLKRLMTLDTSIVVGSAVPTGSAPVILDKAQIADIQRALIALGYDLGPMGADGIYGVRTTNAIKLVQAACGLPATGAADADTRAAIFELDENWEPRPEAAPIAAPLGAATPDTPAAPEPAPPTEQVVATVQRRLRELGWTDVGEVDGLWGDRTRGAVLAYRAAQGLPLIPRIDSELLVSLAGAAPREVAPARAGATLAEVAAKVPAVAAARAARVLSAGTAVATSAGALLVGMADNIGTATDRLSPLKLLVGAVPGWVWVGAVAGVAVMLWRASRKAESAGVQDYRAARTM